MKRRQGKRHSPEQIIRKLREADAMLAAGKTIGQVCQVLEVSEQTFHRWRNQVRRMKAEEAKRLKELENENKRPKKLMAEAGQDRPGQVGADPPRPELAGRWPPRSPSLPRLREERQREEETTNKGAIADEGPAKGTRRGRWASSEGGAGQVERGEG